MRKLTSSSNTCLFLLQKPSAKFDQDTNCVRLTTALPRNETSTFGAIAHNKLPNSKIKIAKSRTVFARAIVRTCEYQRVRCLCDERKPIQSIQCLEEHRIWNIESKESVSARIGGKGRRTCPQSFRATGRWWVMIVSPSTYDKQSSSHSHDGKVQGHQKDRQQHGEIRHVQGKPLQVTRCVFIFRLSRTDPPLS
jgi:hypothetical protein